jgi:transcriptional regulator with XRE-family HTH domain
MGKTLKILAGNLNALIGPGRRFSSNDVAARASGVGRSTIDRARKAEVALRLDNLEQLALAVKAEPWQLLVEQFNVENPPILEGNRHQREPIWHGFSAESIAKIPSEELQEVLVLIKSKVERYSAEKLPSPINGPILTDDEKQEAERMKKSIRVDNGRKRKTISTTAKPRNSRITSK